MPHEADDDNFEIAATEAQPLRPEDFSGPWRGTIKDITLKDFPFGARYCLLFEKTDDYFLLHDKHIATINREVGSKRRNDWIGTTIELSPDTYKNKAGETKHIFNCRVIKAPGSGSEE